MNALSRFSAIMNPQNLIMIVSLIIRCIMRLLGFQCMNGLLPEPSSVTLIHEPTHHLGSFEDPLGVHVKGGSEGTVHPTTHHHGHPFQCCSRHAGTHSSIDISHDFSVLPCVTSWRSREMRLLVDVSEWPEAQLRIGRWLAYEPRHKRHPSLEAAI